MNPEANPWVVLGEKPVYDNPWMSVTQYDVLNPAGGQGIYGKVHFKNIAVGVVPIEENGDTYLVGQFRFTIDRYSWEIPAGGSPLGTEPLHSAQRELQEETGLLAAHWQPILQIHLSNSLTDEYGIIYLARGLRPAQASPEETEQLQVRRLPVLEAYQEILAGRITDSLTIAGILRVRTMLYENGNENLQLGS